MSKRLTIAQVAADRGVSTDTALRLVKSRAIPGGELLYKTETGRERWMVDRDTYERWRAALAAPAVNSPPGLGSGRKQAS